MPKSRDRFTGWYPSDPHFREEFNGELAKAIRTLAEHRDTTVITTLLRHVKDNDLQKRILRKIVNTFPLDYNLKTGALKFRKLSEPYKWGEIPRIDAFESITTFHRDTINIGKVEYSVTEFVEEIIDTLILARRLIGADHIARLSETITAISNRNEKKLGIQ